MFALFGSEVNRERAACIPKAAMRILNKLQSGVPVFCACVATFDACAQCFQNSLKEKQSCTPWLHQKGQKDPEPRGCAAASCLGDTAGFRLFRLRKCDVKTVVQAAVERIKQVAAKTLAISIREIGF